MPGRTSKKELVPAAARLRELSADLLKIASDLGDTMSSKDAHKLRTSVRRIEVVMEGAEGNRGTKKLHRQLDSMRRAAGHVRDIDVQTDLLQGLDAGDYSSDCSTLKNELLRRREKLERKAAKQVSKELAKDLEGRLGKLATAMEDAGVPPRVTSRERIETIREQYVEFTTDVPLDGDPLHDLRKVTKRLRYRLEAIPGRESRALEKEMKVVQDAIGDWHDWATLTEEGERRLAQRSIAFVAFMRSRSTAKRHEARRAIQALRQKLLHAKVGKKRPVSSVGRNIRTLEAAG
jgi:CHAD domain-containing protein